MKAMARPQRPTSPTAPASVARRRALQAALGPAWAAGLVMAPGCLRAQALAASGDPAEAQTRRLRFEWQFINPGGQPLPPQPVWAYAPLASGPHQRLLHIDATAPVQRSTDAWGHTVLHWMSPALPPHGQRRMGLDVSLRLWPQPLPDAVSAGAWLAPERFVECDHPEVQALARQLQRATPRASAQAIFEWVAARLSYAGYLADDLGALQALQQGRGDCTEYAYLVVALCRALGLPARALGGFVVAQDAAPTAAEYHNWAEVHIEGAWRLVDAQKQALFEGGEQYVGFRRIGDRVLGPMGLAHRFVTDGPAQVRLR